MTTGTTTENEKKHVVAFCSMKGGTGKTTICCVAAFAAAENGHSVVVVDFDVFGTELYEDVLFTSDSKQLPDLSLKDLLFDDAPYGKILSKLAKKDLVTLGEIGDGNGPHLLPTYRYPPTNRAVATFRRERELFERYASIDTPYLRKRIGDVIGKLLDMFEVVLLDMPPFPAGIAETALDVLKERVGDPWNDKKVKRTAFFVTSPDLRDIARFDAELGRKTMNTTSVVNISSKGTDSAANSGGSNDNFGVSDEIVRRVLSLWPMGSDQRTTLETKLNSIDPSFFLYQYELDTRRIVLGGTFQALKDFASRFKNVPGANKLLDLIGLDS